MAIIKLTGAVTKIGWLMKLIEDNFGDMELVNSVNTGYIDPHEGDIYTYRILGGGVPQDDTIILISIYQDEQFKHVSKWEIVK